MLCIVFCFQAEDGIRDLVRSRGLGDVYKRQVQIGAAERLGLPNGVAACVAFCGHCFSGRTTTDFTD